MEYPFKDLLPLDEVLAREGYYKDWTHLDPEVFYSLTQISNFIKTKGYGVDVRMLIAQLAEHFGLKTGQVVDLANLLQQQFTNLEGVTQSFTNNINSLVAQMEADKNAVIANATVDSEVILARGGEDNLSVRLDKTRPMKNFDAVPIASQLAVGELGVVTEKQVRLEVASTYPKNGSIGTDIFTPIFIKFNMPVQRSTLSNLHVRLMYDDVTIATNKTYDATTDTLVLIPSVPLVGNRAYRVELTDGIRSVNGYYLYSANTTYRLHFRTGDGVTASLSDNMTDYTTNWTVNATGNGAITQDVAGRAIIDTSAGGAVTMTAMEATRTYPFTADFVIRAIDAFDKAQIRLAINGRRFILGFTGNLAFDLNEENVVSKQVAIDPLADQHIHIAANEFGDTIAYVNGNPMYGLSSTAISGSRIQIYADKPNKFQVDSVYAFTSYREM